MNKTDSPLVYSCASLGVILQIRAFFEITINPSPRVFQPLLLLLSSGAQVRAFSGILSFFISTKWPFHRQYSACFSLESILLLFFVFFVARLHRPIYPEDSRKAFLSKSVKLAMLSSGFCHGASLGSIYSQTPTTLDLCTLVCNPAQMRFKG